MHLWLICALQSARSGWIVLACTSYHTHLRTVYCVVNPPSSAFLRSLIDWCEQSIILSDLSCALRCQAAAKSEVNREPCYFIATCGCCVSLHTNPNSPEDFCGVYIGSNLSLTPASQWASMHGDNLPSESTRLRRVFGSPFTAMETSVAAASSFQLVIHSVCWTVLDSRPTTTLPTHDFLVDFPGDALPAFCAQRCGSLSALKAALGGGTEVRGVISEANIVYNSRGIRARRQSPSLPHRPSPPTTTAASPRMPPP